MKSFVRFGLVAALAFLVGAIWQSGLLQKEEAIPRQLSKENPAPQPVPAEEKVELLASPEPSLGTAEARAIEHYRAVIRLGVAERLAQQRIYAEARKQREALAASAEKERKLAQIEEQKRQTEREKMQRQLILATANAQDLSHERAQQAALETQLIIQEKQRLLEEEAQHEYLRRENKRLELLNLHAEHQLISTNQARRARAAQRPHRREEGSPRRDREEHRGSHQETSHQPQRSAPHAPPAQTPPSRASQGSQHKQAVQTYKEVFKQGAAEQKERIRNVWKK